MIARLPILLFFASTSQGFQILSSRPTTTALNLGGMGILEMAERDASIVFPAEEEQQVKTTHHNNNKEAFLGTYEDLVMPGKEGHGYQLIFEDDESFRLYVLKQQQQEQQRSVSDEAQKRARAQIGYFADRDVMGMVPDTTKTISSNIQAKMRANIDFFSSHAVATILDQTAVQNEEARQLARDNIDFFSTPLAIHLPKDTLNDVKARARARENIDFFTFKDVDVGHHTFHKIDEARNKARNNIDFFSNAATRNGMISEKIHDTSAEQMHARLNIGFFS